MNAHFLFVVDVGENAVIATFGLVAAPSVPLFSKIPSPCEYALERARAYGALRLVVSRVERLPPLVGPGGNFRARLAPGRRSPLPQETSEDRPAKTTGERDKARKCLGCGSGADCSAMM